VFSFLQLSWNWVIPRSRVPLVLLKLLTSSKLSVETQRKSFHFVYKIIAQHVFLHVCIEFQKMKKSKLNWKTRSFIWRKPRFYEVHIYRCLLQILEPDWLDRHCVYADRLWSCVPRSWWVKCLEVSVIIIQLYKLLYRKHAKRGQISHDILQLVIVQYRERSSCYNCSFLCGRVKIQTTSKNIRPYFTPNHLIR